MNVNHIEQSDLEEIPSIIRVILVENDDILVVNFLKKFGAIFKIKVIDNAEECLSYIKNTYPPDAIVISSFIF